MLALLCRLFRHPLFILLLAIVLLAVFWWVRDYIHLLFWLYAGLLLLLGLMLFTRIVTRILTKRCRKLTADPKGDGSFGHKPSNKLPIPSIIYKRPDPTIYSQQYLMSQGMAVTWDNPDIYLEENGVVVSSHAVKPATQYKIVARIWNNSTEAPAVNMLVRFYYLDFGAGGARIYIGKTYVDVAVKGSPALPAYTAINWLTPAQPGHYCLQVELVWSDDANVHNNLGQENVDIKQLNSPQAKFQLNVHNDFAERKIFRLQGDGYRLRPRLACDEISVEFDATDVATHENTKARSVAESDARASLLKDHWYQAQSLPDNWQIIYSPDESFVLDAGETQLVEVTVIAPDEPLQPTPVNINVFVGNTLVDGVTLYVHK